MDQVIMLLRNPRWAIPSYHNMRWELDYATTWQASFLRIPDTYTERPTVEIWEQWRDGRLNTEMNRWFNFIDFWMTGGFVEWKNETHTRCLYSEIDCHPKTVIDFDHFYQENPTNEFSKITDVLDSSVNVEVIAAQARACVLDKVFNRTELHNANRPFPDLQPMYRFTVPQFDRILNRTIELIEKFGSEEPLAFQAVEPAPPSYYTIVPELLRILEKYNLDNYAEYQTESVIFLEEWVENKYGTTDCTTLDDATDVTVCTFMKNKDNHDIFTDGYYPDDFPYDDWLEVRKMKYLGVSTLSSFPYIKVSSPFSSIPRNVQFY